MGLLKQHSRTGTVFIDTTAKVVRNAPALDEGSDQGKPRPYVYGAMVVKPGAGRHSVPVSEMLTTAQDAVTATSWLMRTRQRWNRAWSGTEPFIKTAVVDDSW